MADLAAEPYKAYEKAVSSCLAKAKLLVKKLQEAQLKPKEQVTLEPYERDHAMVVGVYRPAPKKKE